MDDTDKRLTELETRLAFQDRTIETLDGVVLGLRADLAKLRRDLGRLEERLETGEPDVGPGNERPPHW